MSFSSKTPEAIPDPPIVAPLKTVTVAKQGDVNTVTGKTNTKTNLKTLQIPLINSGTSGLNIPK